MNIPIEFISKNQFIFLFLLTFIFFHKFFESIISILFVTPFFSSLQVGSYILDGLFMTITVGIVLSIFIKKNSNYYISDKSILISCITIIIFLYYRFCNNSPWSFTPLKIFPIIAYADIVILYLASIILLRIIRTKKEYPCKPDLGFYFDNPIKDINKDTLGRKTFAEDLAKRIINTADSESSFAIGIISEWGYGKTSLLNLIEDYLSVDNHIIVRFNPWLNNDEQSVIISFFNILSNKLKNINPELSNELIRYAEMLSNVENTYIKATGQFIQQSFTGNKDLFQRFENINEAIKESGLQIIIFIDDIDRLYAKEVVEILRLIRNSANFSNTVFIVAYDRSYVINAIKKANEYKPNKFLEKIFQLEVALPIYSSQLITNQLQEQIRPHLTQADQNKFDSSFDQNISPMYARSFRYDLLQTPREVNRFANSFMIAYQRLQNEIELQDLLNLELLRIKYLGVYSLLANDYNRFLSTKEASDELHQTGYYFTPLETKEDNKSALTKRFDANNAFFDMNYNLGGKKSVLEEYLEKHYSDVGISQNDIVDVLVYVFAIFPSFSGFATVKGGHLSIKSPSSIDRYFYNALLNCNLSEVEFSKYRNSSSEEFVCKIDEWIAQGLSTEVRIRLEKIVFFSDKIDFEKVVNTIFYYASCLLPLTNQQAGFDSSKLQSLINSRQVKTLYAESDELKNFLIHVLKEQPDPYSYVSTFIDHAMEHSINWDFALTLNELIALKIWYFEMHSKQTTIFDRDNFYLFHYCKYKEWNKVDGSSSYEIKTILPEKAKTLFIESAIRLIDSFIQNIITRYDTPYDNTPVLYSILKTTQEVWNTWNEFEKFINEFEEDKINGMSEFKRFFQKVKENDYLYVQFDFKEIDLSKALLFSE